jgi:hypothetical protein
VAAGSDLGVSALTARATEGYFWQNLVLLTVPGVETSQWIGDTCTTSDGSMLAAVYAPREVTNSEASYNDGAYAAVMDLRTGEVTDLGRGFSIAYFNPGCGTGDSFVLTSFEEPGRTTLTVVEAASEERSTVHIEGPLTSATTDEHGIFGCRPPGSGRRIHLTDRRVDRRSLRHPGRRRSLWFAQLAPKIRR